MASGLTPIYSLPYPLSTDGVDVHGDMESLADKVEEILSVKSNLNVANTFNGLNTFSVNSASPAVKITQTGFGAALLVEDATSVDSSPFIINNDGRVGIGTALPQARLHITEGGVIFDTSVIFNIDTVIGEVGEDTDPVSLSVYGSITVRDALQVSTFYATESISYRDSGGLGDINILTPTGGITSTKNLVLPDVNGTFVTTGNRNDAYPSQTGNSTKVLTTNGTDVSWVASPNQVPAITGQTGKWLTNNGTTYYWENLLLIPALDNTVGTGTTGKWMTNDGDEVYWDFLPGQEAFIEVTDDIVLEVGANLFCDTRGGFFTITLPDNPIPGTTVSVFDTQDFFQSEYVIIDPGTEKINTIEGNLIIDVGGATVVFIYINETIGWRLA
jgi:hypothetical protein